MRDRITLDMTTMDALMALAEGNPGAVKVCMDLLTHGSSIDPDSAMGGLMPLLNLDSRRIYGHRIWKFYKDVCGERLGPMIAIMRADQLGQLAGVNRNAIDHAIDNHGEGIDIDAVVAAVTERLPAFSVDAA